MDRLRMEVKGDPSAGGVGEEEDAECGDSGASSNQDGALVLALTALRPLNQGEEMEAEGRVAADSERKPSWKAEETVTTQRCRRRQAWFTSVSLSEGDR